ncbi:MAG: hypothetical protein KJ063_13945 [Anaerolineae bacterium]|nr:hypothetical protein [Anaerolineae bacterium]
MKHRYAPWWLLLPILLLVACQGTTSGPNLPLATDNEPDSATTYATLEDTQGKVTVVVKPLNLDGSAETIDFEITLDTHSVDLSMDLATMSSLTTDNGRQMVATGWDAPQGGHHVSGVLSFPAIVDGAAWLKGATTLTLTLRDVDVPERVFIWKLTD